VRDDHPFFLVNRSIHAARFLIVYGKRRRGPLIEEQTTSWIDPIEARQTWVGRLITLFVRLFFFSPWRYTSIQQERINRTRRRVTFSLLVLKQLIARADATCRLHYVVHYRLH
jgi:hypothetical protein